MFRTEFERFLIEIKSILNDFRLKTGRFKRCFELVDEILNKNMIF